MTVRQLESMIRLSEAIARLHGDTEVKAHYCEEAARLLKSSVIRVETDNIDLDGAEKGWQAAAERLGELAVADQPIIPEKLSIRYEDYVRISNMLVYQLRRIEALSEFRNDNDEADVEPEPSESGTTKLALIEWYLEQIEGDMETEEDFQQKRHEVSRVIERLVHKDGVLIELGVRPENGTEFNPILVVHPNYSPA
jgi:DNA replication licensing factor MCM6